MYGISNILGTVKSCSLIIVVDPALHDENVSHTAKNNAFSQGCTRQIDLKVSSIPLPQNKNISSKMGVS